MTDYTELVKALRYCGNFTEREGCDESCEYFNDMDCPNRIMSDAAAAIEELLPKRGEWVELADRNERKYSHTCSNCHRFHIYEGEIEFYHYCPNCGAKMEVQDESAGSV